MSRLTQLSRSIDGKVAVVTGAASGMGRATAHLLAVKQRVLTTSIPDIAPIVARLLRTDEPERMRALIEKLNA